MGQQTTNKTVAVSTSSVPVLDLRTTRRKRFTIINTSATAVITIAYGDTPAVQNAGEVLQPGGYTNQSDDAGFDCWQGPVQVVASDVGSVAVVEQFRDDNQFSDEVR